MSLKSLSSRAITGRYYKSLEAVTANSWVDGVSTLFGDSDQASEEYKWLGQVPALREWIAGRQAKGLRDNGITIPNKHFEATLEIPCADIRRDKTAQIQARIDELSGRSAEHWAKLISPLIDDGESGTCYDSSYFFAADHAEGDSGTQSNLLTSSDYGDLEVVSSTAPTAAEMEAALLSVIGHLIGLVDDQGEPMNANGKSWLVMAPNSKLFTSALAAVKNAVINQSTNTLQSTDWSISVQCNPRLTWTASFAVFRTDANVKALIRQEETPLAMKVQAEGSQREFDNDVWQFGIDGWRNAGYGYWQMAAKATLSTAATTTSGA